jgi:dephospho-CoA kinase
VLRVGLTGGIGSGKSTVGRRLVELGAVLVDSDVLAREAVAPGSPGLAEIVEAFGPRVLGPAGELDRPTLAAVVFGDPAARERLNAIVHPLVRVRSDEIIAAVPPDAIVVQDVPLLVENGMAPAFPLVVVVHAEPQERVDRLVRHRGMPEPDARARIAAQADDAARRAAADVWLDNNAAQEALVDAVDALWRDRLRPFEENMRLRRPARAAPADVVPADPTWAAQAARIGARVAAAAGVLGRGVAHIGATAVPALPSRDVLELQLGVASRADAEAVCDALADIGFPRVPTPNGPPRHAAADPGRPAELHVREIDSAEWRAALLLRDWLRADADARREWLASRGAAVERAEAWAGGIGWSPM